MDWKKIIRNNIVNTGKLIGIMILLFVVSEIIYPKGNMTLMERFNPFSALVILISLEITNKLREE